MTALLDTHVLIWWLSDRMQLSPRQREVVEAATPDGTVFVSDISLWEVAMLASLGRIRLALPLREWLDKAVAPPLVRRQGISPAVATRLRPCWTRFTATRQTEFW